VKTIRDYLRRRVRVTAAIFVGGMLLLIYLLGHWREHAWGRSAVIAAFCLMSAALLWSGWLKCPRCGTFVTRNDFARFAWPFLREPDTCPECGISLDTPLHEAAGSGRR
jgi:hypothetical protein